MGVSKAVSMVGPNHQKEPDDQNQTMIDESINSVSQDKSINNSFANSEAKAKEQKKQEKFNRIRQRQILTEHLLFFDERMEFDSEIYKEYEPIYDPSVEDIAAYSKYITVASKMESEIPILALVYIERILRKTGILLNKYNWKRILLVCMCVASKVWDDDSLENVHFPKVMEDVTLSMLNRLESIFLDLFVNFDLMVKGSEYAKYYFIMRSLAEDIWNESQDEEEKQTNLPKITDQHQPSSHV